MGEVCTASIVSGRLMRTVALDGDVSTLNYVSGKREEALHRLGVQTVEDLLLRMPHRYLDFTRAWSIEMAPIGSVCTIVGEVDRITNKQPRPRMQVTEVMLVDATGVLQIAFFRQPWIAQQLKVGDRLAVMGKVEFAYGFKQIASPHFEKLDGSGAAGTILPVHFVCDGISQAWMRRIVSTALEAVGDFCDPLPAALRTKRHLMSASRAVRALHFPSSMGERDLARRRLAYDESLMLQLALRLRGDDGLLDIKPYAHTPGAHYQALLAALPFALSDEQAVAVEDIVTDMQNPEHVMNRLLLGDVGTGKTAVASCAIAVAADTGTQACVMAPTGVLARQYAEKIGPLLDAAGISWALLTGSTKKADRPSIHERLLSGELDVLFGTHAVLSDDVVFKHLSLVVIDEQHRFGVGQRNRLRAKGPGADLLVMTATPIPRTLALSIYGDLDTSIIKHRPVPGAGVETRVLTEANRDIAYGAIREAHEQGRQAYVICPLVEPSDSAEDLDDVPGVKRDDEGKVTLPAPLHDTATELDRLRLALPGLAIERLHGRMSPAEKDRVIDSFKQGDIDVLVSTTVVEVGVDVPNATVMVIENGDRFGLAALHQLRGRVGRGGVPGTCYVMTYSKNKGGKSAAQDRLESLEKTSDGFELAEQDLRLRHEGEILGYRQHGGVTLRFVDLESDADLIEWAHLDAVELLRYARNLDAPATLPLKYAVVARYRHIFKEVSGG